MRLYIGLYICMTLLLMLGSDKAYAQDNIHPAGYECGIIGMRDALDVSHTPRDDVAYNGEYALALEQYALPDPISVPITLDIVERLALSVPEGLEGQSNPLVYVDVYKDGRIVYNGQEINTKLNTHCQKIKDQELKKNEPSASTTEPAKTKSETRAKEQ